MFDIRNENSSNKQFCENSNCNNNKPRIFFSKKIYTNKMETKEKENSILFLSKKTMRFVVERNEEHNKKKLVENEDTNEGRWSKEEHDNFLDGIVQYGINWRKVKTLIDSRTPIQVRSHAQKFFRKLKMCKDEQLGIDFTKENISSIRDMIHQIKEININYNIKYIFKYLTDKLDKKKKTKKYNECTTNLYENKEKFNKYNNILENGNNNLLINLNSEMNILNNSPQLLNVNQIYNNNTFPLNNNILFTNNNNNFISNNFFDYQNALTNCLLMNELNHVNNNSKSNNCIRDDFILSNILSNINNPLFLSAVDKLITLLNINNINSNKVNSNNGFYANISSEPVLNINGDSPNTNSYISNLYNNNFISNNNLNIIDRNNNFLNEIQNNNILNPDNIINNNRIKCIKEENNNSNNCQNIYDNNLFNFYNNQFDNNLITRLNNNIISSSVNNIINSDVKNILNNNCKKEYNISNSDN